MTSSRIARRTRHIVLAGVAASLALAVPASAATIQTNLRPDLVVSAPLDSHTYSDSPSFNGYPLTVANNGVTQASSSQVSATFQPVTRITFQGKTSWVNMPGSSPIVGAAAVGALNGGGASQAVTVNLPVAPSGYYRVTACADSTNVVSESNESNNCTSAILDMQPIFFG